MGEVERSFFCSSMPINHINQPHCQSSTQKLGPHVRQSGLVLLLRNFGVSRAKSQHGLTVADLGLFRRQPQQNSRGLLLSSNSFGPHASGGPEDSHKAKR